MFWFNLALLKCYTLLVYTYIKTRLVDSYQGCQINLWFVKLVLLNLLEEEHRTVEWKSEGYCGATECFLQICTVITIYVCNTYICAHIVNKFIAKVIDFEALEVNKDGVSSTAFYVSNLVLL